MIDTKIKKLVKVGKDIVIELDDEVEYLLDMPAMRALESENTQIDVMRLYDHKRFLIDRDKVINTLVSRGAVDYLDSRE